MRAKVAKSVVKKHLTQLAKKHGGMLTTKSVVDFARPVDSPLHEAFEWNDSKAAEEYRLWQARQLIASVRVTIADKEFDGFYNVRVYTDDTRSQGYFTAEKVGSNEELHRAVLEQALLELKYWKNKYKEIIELKDVLNDDEINRLTSIV